MWSAKQAALKAERGRKRRYKTTLHDIEQTIKLYTKHGESYCYWDGSTDKDIEQRVVDTLRANGYQVTKDRTINSYEIAWKKENENAEND